MITIEVNGKSVQANEGETILTVLRREGINVPTLCYVDGLTPTGACRMCVVEVEGARGLVPACAYPVADGMKVQTHSPRAIRARKTIIELLLADHPDDCLYCVRSGSCQLQTLAQELGVRQKRFSGEKSVYPQDVSSPSIVRDPEKCILCGKCVRVCEEVQAVSAIDFVNRGSQATVGTPFDQGLNCSTCINCGQCIQVCPTGALREKSDLKEVIAALQDPEMHVVVQHAPAVSVSVGEEFNIKAGTDVMGMMTTAFRKLGFDKVFDTSFTADLTIMEEGSELVDRITNGKTLPMFTSCSPGWIKYVETFEPDFIDNLSSCKSPQQMLGAIIKSYYAEKAEIDPKKIFSVSVMPCTAKKFEARRNEMGTGEGVFDIDAVLTTRELARLIRMRHLDFANLEPEHADNPFGERTTAGKLFGASGGVMEAAIRSAYFLVTGKELEELKVDAVRGLEGVKEATVDIDGLKLNIAVVSGLGNAHKLLEDIKAGKREYHFVEVMTCPGGCVNGGGQPHCTDTEAVVSRMKALYKIDRDEEVRVSHKNEAVMNLYKEYLGEPLGEKSHKLLHTHYHARKDLI